MLIEQRLEERGLRLPEPSRIRPDMPTPFARLRIRGNRLFVSGQGPRDLDGDYHGPFGSVPSDVSLEEGQEAARKVALAMLGELKRELGDLDRIAAWLNITGFVNADPGYDRTTMVMNGFSDLIIDIFGDEIGQHARSAIGVAALPNNAPVIVAAEIEIR